jgi:alkylation response protein AidB-like acyl-CoA dehydrogenase
MRLGADPEVEKFRAEFAAFLDEHLPTPAEATDRSKSSSHVPEWARRWQQTLFDAGWLLPGQPPQYGGRNATLEQVLAHQEELSRRGICHSFNPQGIGIIAASLLTFGTEEQKRQWAVPLLRAEITASIGMSEPGAGSDLAGLRTRAVLDGDEFVVNGQKTWNSLAPIADWCQLYVRTDPEVPKHKGISCFLVDLRTPGIEVRPIRTMTGDQTFGELYFTEARIPASALLGPLDGGWTVAMTTLSFERAGVARLHLGLSRKLDRLLSDPGATDALRDPKIRVRVAAIYADIACMRWMTNRSLARMRSGQPTGADGSMTKLAWGRAEQKLSALALDVLGLGAASGEWAFNLTASPQSTIAGGTSEINLNIVAEMGLGLPREPRVG